MDQNIWHGGIQGRFQNRDGLLSVYVVLMFRTEDFQQYILINIITVYTQKIVDIPKNKATEGQALFGVYTPGKACSSVALCLGISAPYMYSFEWNLKVL